MDSLNLNKHISGQFNAELESIRTQVMTMGGMVEQQLSDAITAMHNQDSDLAKRVIEGDKNVNMMEDSRTIPSVLTALFCARSIERIGDRCQNICEFIFYYVKGQDFRHVGGDELDKLLAGKDSDK